MRWAPAVWRELGVIRCLQLTCKVRVPVFIELQRELGVRPTEVLGSAPHSVLSLEAGCAESLTLMLESGTGTGVL